jgi:hypothetical protein
MKALKILGLIFGSIVVLVLLLVGAAFVPAVQTWAVRKAVSGQPGLKLEVSRVSAGLSSTEISDLRFVQDGLVVTARRVFASYSVWDYLAHKQVNIGQVAIQNLDVDTRQMAATSVAPAAQPSVKASAPAPQAPAFLGIFHLARLPLDVRLASLAADGRAELPGGRTVEFTLKGGGIASGQSGQLSWKIDYADPAKEVPVRALHANGSVSLRITADRRIDLIELENTAAAEGPQLPAEGVRLELKAEQAVPDGDETYTTRLSLLRNASTEPVFNSRIVYVASAHRLDGTWDVAVRSEQLTALLAGLGLPEASVDGAGKFSFQPDTTAVVANGELNARVAGLERLGAQFQAIGPLQLHAAYDCAFADNVARLNRLEIGLGTTSAQKLVDIGTTQPVSFNVATKQLTIFKPDTELARIALHGLPLAWAQSAVKALTIDGGELSASFSVMAEANGSQVHLRTVEPLTLAGVTLRDGDRKLVDHLNLSLSPAIDYSATKVTASVPDLSLTLPEGDMVNAKFDVEVTDLVATPIVAFAAQFQERLVGVVRPYLSYLPADSTPILVDSSVEGRLQGQKLQLARFTSTVTLKAGAPLVSVETLQPVTADLGTVRVTAANPAAPAARVSLGRLSLTLAQSFVAKSKFAGTFNGTTIEISLPAADKIAVRTVAPISVRGFEASIDGQSLAKGLDLDLDFSAVKGDTTVSANVPRLELRQGTTVLAKLNATGEATLGDKLKASGKGHLEADLAAIMKQPVFSTAASLSRGNLTTDFDVVSGDPLQARAKVTLRNLVAGQGGQPLGDFDCQADATLKADGSAGSVKMPLTLAVGSRRSDLTVDAGFTRTPSLVSFTAKIGSNQIIVDDFQALAALAPQTPATPASAAPGTANTKTAAQPAAKPTNTNPPAANAPAKPAVATAASPAAPARDTDPFWKGIAGQIDADLKLVKYGRDYTISNIHGTAVVTDTRLALDNLDGKFQENAFKVVAGISFSAKDPQPYTLTGSVNIPGFDVGAFLRSANPNEAPALETKLTITAKLDGRGATLPDLAQNAYGQFDVTGTKGTLRALGNKGGQTAGLASGGLKLLGAFTGNDASSALGELTGYLQEMPFDHFAMQVKRGTDLNLNLTSLEFISPETRLTGHGTIQHQKGVSIMDQPLHVEMQLAGKDHMAFLLGKLYVLGDQKDDKGYTMMSSPFVEGGTVSKPDSSQLWKIVGSAGAKALAPAAAKALEGLFGR